MRPNELNRLGIPHGEAMKAALAGIRAAAAAGVDKTVWRATLEAVVADPESYRADPYFTDLAEALCSSPVAAFVPRSEPAPYRQWGEDLDPASVEQLQNACQLPVAVAGALMPDAHKGYGLPIGGVLATHNAVIPYAVGVDIACRMKLSVLDLDVVALEAEEQRLQQARAGDRLWHWCPL